MLKSKFSKSLFLLLIHVLCVNNIVLSQSNTNSNNLIVNTTNGKIRGVNENNVFVWKGIRYAETTGGVNRFKDPQPVKKWDGIVEANEFQAMCPQFQNKAKNKKLSEDCLFLNVWSSSPDTKNKPVMFWIHGGGYYSGAGSLSMYDGANLVKKGDVVVVTINYRMGAFGFLYFDELKGTNSNFNNNLGIKDQVAALKWVKDNIEKFGGDPNNITIFGQSAGATSVLALMTSPFAKGLFHKAIAQSPAFHQSWTKTEATQFTKNFLASIGVSENNLSALYTISSDTLEKYGTDLTERPTYKVPGICTFAPTIDNDFIFPYLADSLTRASNPTVPLLIGTMRHEMNFFMKIPLGPFSAKPKDVDKLFAAHNDEPSKSMVIASYKNYPSKQTVLNICTDGVFTMPCINYAEKHSTLNPTYMYRFDWNSLSLNLAGYKACHALDIFFVFNAFKTPNGKRVSTLANKHKLHRISNQVQSSWINFAKTGDPNMKGSDTWKKYEEQNRATMIFDKKTKVEFDPNKVRRKYWERIRLR